MYFKNTSLYFAYLSCLCLLFVGCDNNNKARNISVSHGGEAFTIAPLDTRNLIDASDLLTNVKFVALQTNQQSLISSIDKVICVDDRYFVWDSKFQNVAIFDHSGEYLGKVGAIGKGPGEFLSIEDIKVSADSAYLIILSNDSKKLLWYTLEGEFSKDMSTGIWGSDFGVLNDDFYLYVNKNVSEKSRNYDLIQINENGSVEGRYFEFKNIQDISIGFAGFIHPNNTGLLYNPAFSDTVFQIRSDLIYPKYTFDFGKKKKAETNREFMDNYFDSDYDHLGKFFIETENGILFSYKSGNVLSNMYCSLDFNTYSVKRKCDLTFPMNYVVGHHGNEIISYLPADILVNNLNEEFMKKALESFPELETMAKNINNTDNPILISFAID